MCVGKHDETRHWQALAALSSCCGRDALQETGGQMLSWNGLMETVGMLSA